MMLIADLNLAIEPAYPWSIPTIGPLAIAAVAIALALLTIWTYAGVQQATWRRVGVVLAFRLAALVVAFAMLARPSIAFTELAGVEPSKLLVVFDASASMNVAEVDGKPTRWEQVRKSWDAPDVQRRLRRLADEEKVEVVQYLGANALKVTEKDAKPDGARTDIGGWLHELWVKHGHEKHLRGIVLFSDGADNGTRFLATDKARTWRGFAPIHAFGAGDPANTKFKKDLALTRIDVKPERIFVKAPMKIEVVAQAPGFEGVEFVADVWLDDVKKSDGKQRVLDRTIRFKIDREKDQKIGLTIDAPDEAGEYKLTVKAKPHGDETNTTNNAISTYVQVSKEKLNVLWVDRSRVYEPTHIIQFALAPEEQVQVFRFELRPGMKGDPHKTYELDKRHYDVVVIGDVSAQQFALGEPAVFETIHKMVAEKRTGLLMLGGTETFAKGGWAAHPKLMSLLPVDLNVKGAAAEFSKTEAMVEPPTEKYPFLVLSPDSAVNKKIWEEDFEALEGLAPLGKLKSGSTELLTTNEMNNKRLVMAATRIGEGRVVVFAGDSTADAWRRNDAAVRGFTHFWKQLVFWLAHHEDRTNQLVVKLDKRRMTTDPADVLGFTLELRDKDRKEVRGVEYTVKVVGAKDEFPVKTTPDGPRARGAFQGAKSPGEHRLEVKAKAKSGGEVIEVKTETRFEVALDDAETQRPLADHEALQRIASASEGRFRVASEEQLLELLEEIGGQVSREARQKTTRWPDWNRLPASEQARDQIPGMWNSFALVSMALFVALLGCEWLLRRLWGMV